MHEPIIVIESVTRNISRLVSTIIDTGFDMQYKDGPDGLKEVATSNSGMLQS